MSSETSINRCFGANVAIVLTPVLSLSCWLLGYAWLAYGRVDDSARSVQTPRMTLLIIGKVSVERGPTNDVLGENLPVPAEHSAALQRIRAIGDGHITQLLGALSPEHCLGCEADIQTARRAQTHLAAACTNIDRLTTLPLYSHSDDGLAGSVNRMIAVIPEFLPIVNTRTTNITRGGPDVLNCLTLTRLSADLHEYADQLGSHFTDVLTMRHIPTFDEQLVIERTQGRISQLRSIIETCVGGQAPLNRHALATLGVQCFGDGLHCVTAVHVKAGQPDGIDVIPATFAERHVPIMRTIMDFRDTVLCLVDDDIREYRRTMPLVLMSSTGAVISVLGALAWITISFHRSMVGPSVSATQLTGGIAQSDLSVHIPTSFVRRKVRAVFGAIRTLHINSIERRRPEVEHAYLMQEPSCMTETDPLTQLFSRRVSEDRTGTMCRLPQPKTRLIASIMFGIDHFKRVNDTYGHVVDDEALRIVIGLCCVEGSSADMAARIGDGESAVVVWVDSLVQACAVTDYLHHRIAEVTVPAGTDLPCRMATSFGVAAAPAADSPRLEPLLQQTGHLLYTVKLAGCNCVMADRPPAPSDVALTAD